MGPKMPTPQAAPPPPDPVRIPTPNDPDVMTALKVKTAEELAGRKGRESTRLAPAPGSQPNYSRTALG